MNDWRSRAWMQVGHLEALLGAADPEVERRRAIWTAIEHFSWPQWKEAQFGQLEGATRGEVELLRYLFQSPPMQAEVAAALAGTPPGVPPPTDLATWRSRAAHQILLLLALLGGAADAEGRRRAGVFSAIDRFAWPQWEEQHFAQLELFTRVEVDLIQRLLEIQGTRELILKPVPDAPREPEGEILELDDLAPREPGESGRVLSVDIGFSTPIGGSPAVPPPPAREAAPAVPQGWAHAQGAPPAPVARDEPPPVPLTRAQQKAEEKLEAQIERDKRKLEERAEHALDREAAKAANAARARAPDGVIPDRSELPPDPREKQKGPKKAHDERPAPYDGRSAGQLYKEGSAAWAEYAACEFKKRPRAREAARKLKEVFLELERNPDGATQLRALEQVVGLPASDVVGSVLERRLG